MKDLCEEEKVYNALLLGTKDYVTKNGFDSVVLGLSGGIDSALTLAIAVDALGADNVEAISMPSRYTADISNQDAARQAEQMGVAYQSIPIEPAFNAFRFSRCLGRKVIGGGSQSPGNNGNIRTDSRFP